MMRRHAELLCQHMGEERGCKEFRKHVSWYLKGFPAGGELRRDLALVSTLAELDELLAQLDPDARSRSPSSARRAVGRAARASGSRCPRAGSTTPTAPAASYARTLGDHRGLTVESRSVAGRERAHVASVTPQDRDLALGDVGDLRGSHRC